MGFAVPEHPPDHLPASGPAPLAKVRSERPLRFVVGDLAPSALDFGGPAEVRELRSKG